MNTPTLMQSEKERAPWEQEPVYVFRIDYTETYYRIFPDSPNEMTSDYAIVSLATDEPDTTDLIRAVKEQGYLMSNRPDHDLISIEIEDYNLKSRL